MAALTGAQSQQSLGMATQLATESMKWRSGFFASSRVLRRAARPPLANVPFPKREGATSALGTEVKDKKTAAFKKWAASVGIKFPRLQLAEFSGVRGVMTTDKLVIDELLMTVPRSQALEVTPTQKLPPVLRGVVSDALWARSEWATRLALLLLAAKHVRAPEGGAPAATPDRSPWIEVLPKELSTPLHWSPSELAELQCPHMIAAVEAQRSRWGELVQGLQRDDVATKGPLAPALTNKEVTWALEMARSRAFSGPAVGGSLRSRLTTLATIGALSGAYVLLDLGEPVQALTGAIAAIGFNLIYDLLLSREITAYVICPMVDMLNHRGDAKSKANYLYFNDAYGVTMAEEVEPGGQAFITYGERSNDQLLQYYGFVERDNPHDAYVLADLPSALARRQRLDAERIAQVAAAGMAQAVISPGTGMNTQAYQVAAFLMSPKEEARAKGIAGFVDASSSALAPQLNSILLEALEGELQNLGTSLEDDEAKVKSLDAIWGNASKGNGRDLSVSTRLALSYRIEKKKILHAAIRGLKSKCL